jgi:two-component system OmpR family sensor kinase
MRSLRGRLVAILLAVSFIGMVVLAAVTYTEQRSFLLDRVDKQVTQAFGPFDRLLGVDDSFSLFPAPTPATGDDNSGSSNGDGDDSGPTGTPGGFGTYRNGPDGGPGGAFNLPPGTFGEQLDEAGNIVGNPVVISFGTTTVPSVPRLTGVKLGREPVTVGSKGDDSLSYRVAKRTRPDGTSTIVAIPLTETHQTLTRLVKVEAVVITAVLIFLGLLSWLLVGIGLRPLDRMGKTADAIAGGDLSHRVEPADERSEIGRLGLALNRMLHRIEQSFAERQASENRLRQFLADASHELRTPLVSIRGYAELHRLGATPEKEDVDRSMTRIEQEAQRMGVLVEDMLTLARLDETHEHGSELVDMSALAKDSVDDAKVVEPDREITLDAPEPHEVRGDTHQLQQVLANLLRNALVHTPAGTKIEVSVTRSGDDVRVDIRDHGPGLPDGVGDQLFERFWRAEAGRERGKAGSGLGLSIVNGIVTQHGGRVHARNADGGGAVFSVWLPVPNLS